MLLCERPSPASASPPGATRETGTAQRGRPESNRPPTLAPCRALPRRSHGTPPTLAGFVGVVLALPSAHFTTVGHTSGFGRNPEKILEFSPGLTEYYTCVHSTCALHVDTELENLSSCPIFALTVMFLRRTIRPFCQTVSERRHMNGSNLTTLGQAAELFQVKPNTIGDLVRRWGIQTKPMINGRARGLDHKDLKVLAKALNVPGGRIPWPQMRVAS